LAESYVTAAQDLTDRSLTDVRRFTGCDPAVLAGNAVSEQACAATFIASSVSAHSDGHFCRRADAYAVGLPNCARGARFKGAIGTVMETVLLAPQFMYRWRLARTLRINLASRPSIRGALLRACPIFCGLDADAGLFNAAQAGALQTRDQVRAQAERMFDDPRTHGVVRHFHDYWLDLLNIEARAKTRRRSRLQRPDRLAARRQTEAFAEQVYFDKSGDLTSLLTAPFNMMNETLASTTESAVQLGINSSSWTSTRPATRVSSPRAASRPGMPRRIAHTRSCAASSFVRNCCVAHCRNPPDNIVDTVVP